MNTQVHSERRGVSGGPCTERRKEGMGKDEGSGEMFKTCQFFCCFPCLTFFLSSRNCPPTQGKNIARNKYLNVFLELENGEETMGKKKNQVLPCFGYLHILSSVYGVVFFSASRVFNFQFSFSFRIRNDNSYN